MFKVSDKVVCVDAKNPAYSIPGFILEEGRVYVIRDIWESVKKPGSFIFQLVGCPEFRSPENKYRVGFPPWRFRKLQEIQEENRLKNELSIGNPAPAVAINGEMK